MLRRFAICILFLPFANIMAQDVTEIREETFHIDLPGKWVASSVPEESNVWIYQSVSGNEQLTVSIFMGGANFDGSKLKKMFDNFVDARRRSEIEAGGPRTELSDTGVKVLPNAVLGRYQGADSSGRRFSNFVVVNRTGIANFYYEAIDMAAHDFEARYPAVLSRVGFIEGDT